MAMKGRQSRANEATKFSGERFMIVDGELKPSHAPTLERLETNLCLAVIRDQGITLA